MKKVIAIFSSLLVFAGVKAQTTPTVKKETTKPEVMKPGPVADSLKAIKSTGSYKLPDKGLKIGSTKDSLKMPHKDLPQKDAPIKILQVKDSPIKS